MKKFFHFFDKLEDKTRATLSKAPLLYAFVGGVGVILFWRGIWHFADDINMSSILSMLIGALILLVTGVFVSSFIGDWIIISGLSGSKKITEKTGAEIELEEGQLKRLQTTLNKVEEKLEVLEDEMEAKK
jgi:hypothetical protein